MKIIKATYVKANKGKTMPTSQSYANYTKARKTFPEVQKTMPVPTNIWRKK
jgi:hypothetical protein